MEPQGLVFALALLVLVLDNLPSSVETWGETNSTVAQYWNFRREPLLMPVVPYRLASRSRWEPVQKLHPGSLRERIQVLVAQWYLVIRLVPLPTQQVPTQVPPQHQFAQGKP